MYKCKQYQRMVQVVASIVLLMFLVVIGTKLHQIYPDTLNSSAKSVTDLLILCRNWHLYLSVSFFLDPLLSDPRSCLQKLQTRWILHDLFTIVHLMCPHPLPLPPCPQPPRSRMYTGTSVLTTQPGRRCLPLRNWRIYVSMTSGMAFLNTHLPSRPPHSRMCTGASVLAMNPADAAYLCETDVSKCVWHQGWRFWTHIFPVSPLLTHTYVQVHRFSQRNPADVDYLCETDISTCVWHQGCCFWAHNFPVAPLLTHVCAQVHRFS